MTATAAADSPSPSPSPSPSSPPLPGASAAAPARRRLPRAGVVVAVLVTVALLLVLYLGRPSPDPQPLDPRSTRPAGLKALVRLLEEELGASVEVTDDVPDPDDDDAPDPDVAFLVRDTMQGDQRSDGLADWVSEGGVAVIADAGSYLTPFVAADLPLDPQLRPGPCSIDALRGLDELRPGPRAVLYDPPLATSSCFVQDGDSFVVAWRWGEGTFVALGGPWLFTNERLDDADNAGLAAALLAPRPGYEVAFLTPPASAQDLPDVDFELPNPIDAAFNLVPETMRIALAQLLVAYLVFAIARGRRLGPAVTEPQPVELAGSELVAAVGRLLERSKDPTRAFVTLRDGLHRDLTDHLSLPRDANPEALAAALAARGDDRAQLVPQALHGATPTDTAQLLAYAQLVDTIRQEVLHGRPT
jgi:hypothetical protein